MHNKEALNWYYAHSPKEQTELMKKHLDRRGNLSVGTIIEMWEREVNGKEFTPIKRKVHKYPVNFIGIKATKLKLEAKEKLTEQDLDNLYNLLHMLSVSKTFGVLSYNLLKESEEK